MSTVKYAKGAKKILNLRFSRDSRIKKFFGIIRYIMADKNNNLQNNSHKK